MIRYTSVNNDNVGSSTIEAFIYNKILCHALSTGAKKTQRFDVAEHPHSPKRDTRRISLCPTSHPGKEHKSTMSVIFSPGHDRARTACPTSAKEDARSVGGLDAEGKEDLSSRLNDGLHVTDEELMRRTPLTKPSPSPSMSFSLGTTPGKQYPSRYAVRSSGHLLVSY